MSRGRHTKATFVLEYPRTFAPEDWVRFIELRTFTEDWNDLNLGDDDLRALQVSIMAAPDRSPVIRGTGGLRKLRFGPASWYRGKRGGARVCYAYLPEHSIVLLVAAYSKSEKDDLTAVERRQIKELLRRFERALEHQR